MSWRNDANGYILILPPLGIIGDVLATFTRTPMFGYRTIVMGLAGVTFLSFLVWGHHMYVSGLHPLLAGAFMPTTIAISVPFAALLVCLIGTLYQGYGRIRPATPLLWAVGMLSLMVTGGLTGLFLGDAPSDIYLHDTYWVVGHFHFTMALATLAGAFAGIYYWFPKLFGRMMDERLGRIHFFVSLPAMYATFIPMHFLGTMGNSRRLYDTHFYSFLNAAQPIDVFISVSAFASAPRRSSSRSISFGASHTGGRPAATRGAPPRSNGRPILRPRTATGTRRCPSSTAGPTSTACRTPATTTSRRTQRPSRPSKIRTTAAPAPPS